MARVGLANTGYRFQKTAEQHVDILRFQLNTEDLMKRLRFRLAHMIIRLIQRQYDAELHLFAHPTKAGERLARERFQVRLQQVIVLLQCSHHFRRRQIQLRQPLSGSANRFKELQTPLAGLERSRRRAGGNERQSLNLGLRIAEIAQAADKFLVDLVDKWLKHSGETLQVVSELFIQNRRRTGPSRLVHTHSLAPRRRSNPAVSICSFTTAARSGV